MLNRVINELYWIKKRMLGLEKLEEDKKGIVDEGIVIRQTVNKTIGKEAVPGDIYTSAKTLELI